MDKKYNFLKKVRGFSFLNHVFIGNCLGDLSFEKGLFKQSQSEKNHSSLVLGVLLTVFASVTGMAQVTTNGGSGLNATYPDLATAITALNGATITSQVVITLTGNETAPAGGYVITAEGSAVNSITIEGVGSSITASPALVSGALDDAIFKFVGADFVKLQGFTMLENAANTITAAGTNNMTEWGVALLYASTTNGCQNITVKNNTIDLDRTYPNSFGIYSNSTHAAATPTAVASATGAMGGNHNTKIYGNTITDVNNGIAIVGPIAAADINDGLDIGGVDATTANTITNFGSTGTFSAYQNVAVGVASGIAIKNAKNCNVSYNTITSSNGGTTSGALRGVYIYNFNSTPVGTFTNSINYNVISLRNGSAAGGVVGISSEASTTTATSTLNINNNNFTDCGHSLTPVTTVPTAGISIISVGAAPLYTNVNDNKFTNLTIGTTGTLYFIFNDSVKPANSVCNVNNNKIVGAFTKANSGGTVVYYTSIGATTPTSATENNNNNDFSNVTVTGATVINGWISKAGSATSPFGATKTVTGNIFNNTTADIGTVTILSVANSNSATVNSVANNTISNYNGSASAFVGINLANGNQSVSGNTISNINTGSGAIKGITTANGTNRIFGNTLKAFKVLSFQPMYGVELLSGTHSVYKNKLYNFESGTGTPTGATVIGIIASAVGQLDIYNNIIGDFRASVNFATAIVGINIGGSGPANVYNNTIVFNAVAPAVTDFGSAALYAGQYVVITVKNNILVNTSGFAGAGKSVAYRRNVNMTNYAAGSNNNLLYASTIYYDGTNSDTTLADFKLRATPRDNSSVSENPTFVSMLGTDPNYLHINTTTPTQIESAGTNVALVTDDFDGDVRSASTPDIGADEFAGVLLDVTGPTITLTPDTTCAAGSRTVSATITDAAGIPTSGAGLPKAYWRLNSGAYVAATGTSMGAGVYNFTIGTGSVPGDAVSYYVVAQDVAATPNVSVYPSVGAAGLTANPPAAATPPTTPNALIIPMGGVYTVGTGGRYATLTAAVADYNTKCLGGPVTFSLTDATYSTAETFPITIQPNADASAVNTLTIKPATGVTATITGSNASAIIKLNGADYVTIDGSNNGTNSKDLTIANTNTSTIPTVIWLASSATTGATNNTVKNTIVRGQSNASTRSAILTSGSAINTVAETANSGNKFQNNTLSLVKMGIEILGPTAMQTGTVISQNAIGTAANTLLISGVSVSNETGTVIDNNTIQGVSTSTAFTPFTTSGGIVLLANSSGVIISNNTIKTIRSIASFTGANSTCGINVNAGANNTIIKGNIIADLANTSTGAYGIRGITISGSGTVASNNMVSDIRNSQGSLVGTNSTIGIAIGGAAANVSLHHNTVYLFGSYAGNSTNTNAGIAACVFIETTGTGLDIRNNILANLYDNSTSGGDKSYPIYTTATSNSQFAAINNNDYYAAGNTTPGSPFLGYLSGDKATLADMITAFGGNANSVSTFPIFVSDADLHLVPASNTALDNLGTPIATVTTDIDGETRSAATPDMGADEFTSACAAAAGGNSTPTAATICTSGSTTISATGYTAAGGITYQWESSSDAAFTTPVNEGVATATYANLTTPTITTTTYYRLKVTCSAGMSAYSTVSTVTVTTTAAPTGAANQGLASGQTVSNIAVNGSNVVWYATAADAANAVNPLPGTTVVNDNTVYYATQTVGGCRSTSSLAVTVTVVMGNDEFRSNEFKYYPNPVNGTLNVEGVQAISSLEVYNVTGQLVGQKTANEVKATYDMSQLPSGTYFVKVTTDEVVKTIQVIKK